MIGPDAFAYVGAAAAVPEQVVCYVTAVADSNPVMAGSCIGYRSGPDFVMVGYPIHDPADERSMADAVGEALRIPGIGRITVIGPGRPPQAPAGSVVSEDYYSFLPVPPPPPRQKLRNMLRRAEREVTVEKSRDWEEEHSALARHYIENRPLDPGTAHIFSNIPGYLDACPGSLIFSARSSSGRLAAFSIGEFGSLSTAFYMFSFRDPESAPPGSTDLLLSALIEEAGARGHTRVNLGLRVNEGVGFFKGKWGEGERLRCVQVSWEVRHDSIWKRLRGFVSTRKGGCSDERG